MNDGQYRDKYSGYELFHIRMVIIVPLFTFISYLPHTHTRQYIRNDNSLSYPQIPRMSFVHSSRIYFNVSCNVNTSALEEERRFRIVYEMVYRGWNDTKDRSTPLQALTFVEGEPKKGILKKKTNPIFLIFFTFLF